jgi:hypothetical protein
MKLIARKIVCFLLGHRFGGYVCKNIQALPDEYNCKRCQAIVKCKDYWC